MDQSYDDSRKLINELEELADDWEKLIEHLRTIGNLDHMIYHSCLKQLKKVIESNK